MSLSCKSYASKSLVILSFSRICTKSKFSYKNCKVFPGILSWLKLKKNGNSKVKLL